MSAPDADLATGPAHPGRGRRVLIADDHAATRTGVRAALESAGFVVCAEVADGPAAVEVLLLDR